jgi:hypothetical protein
MPQSGREKIMRVIALTAAALVLLMPGLAAAAISCDQIPKAESFVSSLNPGPNTREAQRHLELAKAAKSPAECSAELQKVDTYARRSQAADRRMASPHHRRVACADTLHQNRPGGSDYHGPPVAGCPTVR